MGAPIVVMGVSGSGKTTVGVAVSRRLGVPFADADDMHPQANIDKMTSGRALDDDDRRPWLDIVGEWLRDHADGGVICCSALKRMYRDQLRSHCGGVVFLHLDGSRDVIAERQADRPGHFMPSSLLDSQFALLEPLEDDEAGATADVSRPVEEIVSSFVATALD